MVVTWEFLVSIFLSIEFWPNLTKYAAPRLSSEPSEQLYARSGLPILVNH